MIMLLQSLVRGGSILEAANWASWFYLSMLLLFLCIHFGVEEATVMRLDHSVCLAQSDMNVVGSQTLHLHGADSTELSLLQLERGAHFLGHLY